MPVRPDAVVSLLDRAAFDVSPTAAARERMRSRLDAVLFVHAAGAEADLSPRRGVVDRVRAWSGSRRLLAALTVASVGLAGAGLLVVASRDALPGDSIYGVKRVSEQAELAFQDPGTEQAETLLAFASNRIDEIDDLLKNPPVTGSGPATGGAAEPASALVNEALASMDTDARRASKILTSTALTSKDPRPLQKIKGWADERATKLAAVQPRLPAGSTDAAANSLTLLKQIGTRASGLLSQLGCDCLDPDTKDGLGPVPSPSVPTVPGGPTSTGSAPSSTPAAPSTSPAAGTTTPAPAAPSSTAPDPAPPTSDAPVAPGPVPLPEPTTEPSPPRSVDPPPATGGTTDGGTTGTAATVDQCITTPLLSICVQAG